MGQLDEMGLKRDLKTEIFRPVYLICGEESYLKQYYALKLANKIAGGPMEDFNLQRFDGGSLKMDQLETAISQLPVMSRQKCVVVKDYGGEAASENKKLAALIREIPEECVLVLWCDTVELNAKKPGKWKEILAAAGQKGAVVRLDRKDETSLTRLLCDGAKKRGSALEPETARYFIRSCGNDMQTLLSELEKLSAYRRGETITKADIDELAVKSIAANVFQLSRLIWAGNGDKAFSLLRDLFSQRAEPVQILAALAGSYVDLYRAKAAMAAGMQPSAVAGDFGYRGMEFRLRNAAAPASKMTLTNLRGCLEQLLDTDLKLKSSPADGQVLLEKLVAELLLAARE